MEEYQELFNKITKELAFKRKELTILKEKLDKHSSQYEQIQEEINSIEEEIYKLEEQKEILPNKNNKKIFNKFYIPALLLGTIPSLIMAYLTVKLLIFLSTLNFITYIILSILPGILGILLPAFINPLIIRKIFLDKLKKSQEEIMLSDEYQNILKEIKILEDNLSLKKDLQKQEEKIMSEVKTEYNITLTEINMKETILEYLKNEGKVLSTSIQTEETQEELKVQKRVRKKD